MSLTGSSHHSRKTGNSSIFTFGVDALQTVGSLVLETSTSTALVWSGLPVTTLFKVDLSWYFNAVTNMTTPVVQVTNGTKQLRYSKGEPPELPGPPYIDIYSDFISPSPYDTHSSEQYMVSYIIRPASNGKIGVSCNPTSSDGGNFGFDAFCIPIDETILT